MESALEYRKVGEGDCQSVNPLKIPLVLRHIFIHLPFEDLLRCAQVDKMWNYESRTVLRDLKKCVAAVREVACTELGKLNEDMSRMNIIPFRGLSIYVSPHSQDPCLCAQKNYDFIEEHLPLKYLELQWSWPTSPTCSAVRFLLKILQKNTKCLEELYLNGLTDEAQCFQPGSLATAGLTYSKLKILRFPDAIRCSSVPIDILQGLLASCPNLEELYLEFNSSTLSLAVEKRLHILKSFLCFADRLNDTNQIVADSGARLQRLTAWAWGCNGGGGENVMLGSLQKILENSRSTLEFLKIDSEIATQLDLIPPCTALTTLHIPILVGTDGRTTWSVLKGIRFKTLFPNLKSLMVYERWTTYSFGGLNGGANCGSVEANHIQNLHAHKWKDDEALPTMAEVFPNVTSFTAAGFPSSIYDQLWACWPQLRNLTFVQIIFPDSEFNLDAPFCGIHPEEAAELQKMDNDFLRNVHIVPIKPSIIGCKKLVDLRIHAKVRSCGRQDILYNYSLLLSRVTGFLTFKRMPNLKVTILCDYHHSDAFHHLRPFATVNPVLDCVGEYVKLTGINEAMSMFF